MQLASFKQSSLTVFAVRRSGGVLNTVMLPPLLARFFGLALQKTRGHQAEISYLIRYRCIQKSPGHLHGCYPFGLPHLYSVLAYQGLCNAKITFLYFRYSQETMQSMALQVAVTLNNDKRRRCSRLVPVHYATITLHLD